MLSASESVFSRRARGDGAAWRAPAAWEDPVFRGVTALAVASLLMPVLVAGILAVSLLSMPFSGTLPPERPTIDSRITPIRMPA